MVPQMRLIHVLRDERGFVHKKLLGIGKALVKTVAPRLTSFIPGGSIVQSIGGRILSGISGRFQRPSPTLVRREQPTTTMAITTPRPTPPRTQTARVTPMSQAQKQFGLITKFPEITDVISTIGGALGIGNGKNGGNLPAVFCEDPRTEDRGRGFCEFIGGPSGGVGEAVMGRFGAALEPSFFTINQRRCLPGMILGKDKLCYNIGAISNKERLWPKGPAPLLSGGEMSAIRKAAGAAKKFERAGGRMRAIGKTFSGPSTSRRAPGRKRITAGTVKVLESGPGSVQL